MAVPSPNAKRPCLEHNNTSEGSSMATAASKMRLVLALCGSFSPVTNLHLRMFGKVGTNLSFFSLHTLHHVSRASQRLPAQYWEVCGGAWYIILRSRCLQQESMQ